MVLDRNPSSLGHSEAFKGRRGSRGQQGPPDPRLQHQGAVSLHSAVLALPHPPRGLSLLPPDGHGVTLCTHESGVGSAAHGTCSFSSPPCHPVPDSTDRSSVHRDPAPGHLPGGWMSAPNLELHIAWWDVPRGCTALSTDP